MKNKEEKKEEKGEKTSTEEKMGEEIKDILREAEDGLNEDSIAAIMLLKDDIEFGKSMIDSLLSGGLWATRENKEEYNLDNFSFHLTKMHPRDEVELYRLSEIEQEKIDKSLENIDIKLSCLLCLQNFLEAGMTDDDAIELFNKYFPEAEINKEDCDFIRRKQFEEVEELSKENEEEIKEIAQRMMKYGRHNTV